jgi:phospholipase C
LLDKIAATNAVGDVLSWIAGGKVHSYIYGTVLPGLQSFLDSHAGVVGSAMTPWLLGAAYTVWDVKYSPTNSQPLPATAPDKPWVPQGDIVVTYIGLADTGGTGLSVGGLNIGTGVGTGASAVSAAGTTLAHAAAAAPTPAVTPAPAPATGFSITTTSPLPRTAIGDAYAEVFAATGGTGAVKWSATGLPAGLTMSASGILSGTPTGDGSVATIAVQAVDADNTVASGSFSLTVLDPLLFGEQSYTPRGAGTAFYSPPPKGSGLPPFDHLPPLTPAVTPGNLSKVDHIVVLMMENRSFDHMLGYLSREGGRSEIEGLKWENDSNRTQYNFYNGRYYYPNRLTDTHLFNPESLGPDHSHESVKAQMADNMGLFVADYARNKIQYDDPAQLSQVMGYYTGEQLPTYDMLAREYCVCDHRFCSHPGPTWPNRFVMLTGDLNRDSYGEPEVNTPLYSDFTPSEATTIFDLLTARKVTWQYFEQRVSTMRAYTKYTFDLVNVLEYSDPAQGFAASVKAGLKSVTFVDPLFGDLPAGINSPQDNDDAPPSDLADGQRFVHEVFNTLFTPSSNPNWQKTMLVICYDEHGGFYDHVQPPSNAVPLTGQNSGKLGPRVPAFIVSPWTPAGMVLKDVFDHTSIAATILNRFCAPHPPILSARVSAARDLRDALPLASPRGHFGVGGTVGGTVGSIGGVSARLSNARLRIAPRPFVASVAPDSFGSLLGAMGLMLGKGAD